MTEKEFSEYKELCLKSPNQLTDRQLAQLRRSNRTGSTLLAFVVAEQKKRGLLKENYSGQGYPPEKIKNLYDYRE